MSNNATLEAHKTTVQRFTEIINSRNYEAFPEVCQPNLVRHCPATPDVNVRSIEDMVAFLEEDLKLLGQLQRYPGRSNGAFPAFGQADRL